MQQEATSSGDVGIEMSLKMSLSNFRTIHEPRSIGAHGGEIPMLVLPQLPYLIPAASTASTNLPAASGSRERRSNTVLSLAQGAFKVKTEDLKNGGIDRAKFKSVIDMHLKRQIGMFSVICCSKCTHLSPSHFVVTDHQTFSNRILDEVYRNKSVLSWEELDAAIAHYQLDKVPMVEPSVRWA